MSVIYKVLGITENGDLRVKSVSSLPEGCELDSKLCVDGKEFGIFWWDIEPENAVCGKYNPQFFAPVVYKKGVEFYYEVADISSLTGETPLDRFSWDTEDPKNESDLHNILLED